MNVTLAIPAQDEESFIEETVEGAEKTLSTIDLINSYEIIISEGGSTDNTKSICRNLDETSSSIKYLDLEDLQGKGRAIEEAFKNSDNEYFLFIDADGAISTDEFRPMLESLKFYDIVIGSRKSPEVDIGILRGIASNLFNYGVNFLFSSNIDDHQCGFKGFRRSEVKDILNDLESQHWFWDTELIIKAQSYGKDIETLEIEWEEKGDSKVDLISDGFYFSRKLVELRIRKWSN